MRVLITGASGFAGRHLSEHAVKNGAEVFGLARPDAASRLFPGVQPVLGDLNSVSSLDAALLQAKPERIFHLAGQASVELAKKDPRLTFELNVEGTRRFLDAVVRFAPHARVLVACSSDGYGASAIPGKKLTEEDALQPVNDYGRSKVEQERVALAYHQKQKLDVVCIRAFNHAGPGQSRGFVAADFASQIAAIEKGRQEPEMKVGDLDAVRDFTDVRDIVGAYWLALEKGGSGEVYNAASGQGHSANEILKFYLKRVSVTIKVCQDPDKMRPSGTPYFVGDAQKFMRATGWQPIIPFETTLQDVLDDWRRRLND
jgi:GDP-4-dehydro-6-deoxy-D-mannose reductase